MAWAAVDPDGPMLAIGAAKFEHHLCQQIPGCNFSKRDGIWRVPLTWPAWVAFRTTWALQPVAIHPDLQRWADTQWQIVQQCYQLRSQLDASPPVKSELQLLESQDAGLRLKPTQRGGVQWLADLRRVALTDPMGNGKMIQGIRALQLAEFRATLGDDRGGAPGGPFPALVVAPGASLLSWEGELRRWAPELSVRLVNGTALRRRRALADEEQADVYLIAWPNLRLHTRLAGYPGQRFVRCGEHGGPEDVTTARCEVHEKELNMIRWGTVIMDEAHKMQDARSKQTRAAWHLMAGAHYAWPMTGTPSEDNIGQLWPILHGLDPAAFPSRSRFLDLFAVVENSWGGSAVLGIRPDNAAALHAIVQPLMRRIPKEIARPDYQGRLEPEFRFPEMTPAQARLYAQLRKELTASLDGAEVPSANDAVNFGRMCRLAGSMIEVADGEDANGFTRQVVSLALPSSKVDDLLDFLDGHDGSLVVAVNSPRIAELAEGKLKAARVSHCKIVGGMSDEEKDQARRWFQDGDCRVIFINSAGAEAITLTRSNTIFFMEPDPSYRSREQKIGRVDRIGQEDPVRVIYSLTPGTVDQRLFELGCQKEGRASEVTRDADLMRWLLASDVPAEVADGAG